MLLAGLFGSDTAEKVLLYMKNYGAGYPRGVATTFSLPVSQIQRQLERFEREGIFSSRLIGRTREYRWNPRYLFREELEALLDRALTNLPNELVQKYFRARARPRRKGQAQPVKLAEVRKWSDGEGMSEKFSVFAAVLKKAGGRLKN